jgi:hypothetical protein
MGELRAILEAVEEVLAKGTMNFKDALSIKGKLQFAEGQLFFRVAAPVCRLLSRWASVGAERQLTPEMIVGLRSVKGSLGAAGPRIVEPCSSVPPVLIFTDGACEPEGTSVGGVLFSPGNRPQVFGARLTRSAAASLTSKEGQTQIIGQAEILPVLIAKTIWSEYIAGKKVIYFIDNDSARGALVKGYSPILASLDLVMQCARGDASARSASWYARVPTKSNIADEPSRMRHKVVVEKLGAKIVKPWLVSDADWFSEFL